MTKREKTLGVIALLSVIGGIYYKMRHTFKYFKYEEFKDNESGSNKMQTHVIKRLDIAREIAGIPFIINSGYRDENHSESIENPTSSHIKGLAVDILSTPQTKDTIINALRKSGFLRIGVSSNFIHADMDDDKPSRLTWFYDGRKTERWA